jgi:hypothetical protein
MVNDAALAYGSHFTSPVHYLMELKSMPQATSTPRSLDRHDQDGRRASLAGLNSYRGFAGLEDGVLYLPTTTNPTERLCLIYSGPTLNRAGAEQWLRTRLDSAFVPRTFVHVDKLPRSDSGKLPRQALDAVFAAWQRGGQEPDPSDGT